MKTPQPVLILGATSTTARQLAGALARRRYALYLASRDVKELERIAADIRIRYGVPVGYGRFDAEDYDSHPALVATVVQEMGTLYGVVYAAGYLGATPPGKGQTSRDAAVVISRNLTGAVSILELCAAYMEQQGRGFIVGISSVGGDRGRKRNYIYGAAKAGLNTYLQGLRHRMYGKGVRVVCIRPGYVDTPMVYGEHKGLLVASPAFVGERIARAAESGPTTVYVPFFWRYLMLVIKYTPDFIFHRTNI